MDEEDEGMAPALVLQEDKNPASVYTLDLSEKNLRDVPKSLRKYKSCKSLKLSCNAIECIKKDDFASCMQVKELKLYGNKINTVQGLWPLEKLEELHLQFNNIEKIGESLKTNKSLTFLRLDNNRLREIKSSEICMLGRLTYLDISNNKLKDITPLTILSSLQVLVSTHNLLTVITSLSKLKKLKEVDFSSNLLTDVSGLRGCTSLRGLILHSNKITDLCPVGTLKGLQELKISHNLLHDLEQICLQFPALEHLDVSHNKFNTPTHLKCLLKLVSTLRELSITGNPMVDDPDDKDSVCEFIKNNLVLDMFNRSVCHRPTSAATMKVTRPPSAAMVMRPMSAGHVISQRMLEDELSFAAMQMSDLELQIKSQFLDLKDSLKDLPDAEEIKAIRAKQFGINANDEEMDETNNEKPGQRIDDVDELSSPQLKQVSVSRDHEERPSSRCGTRARLNEAMAYAQQYCD